MRRDPVHFYVVNQDELNLRTFAWLDDFVPWLCVGLGMIILSALI